MKSELMDNRPENRRSRRFRHAVLPSLGETTLSSGMCACPTALHLHHCGRLSVARNQAAVREPLAADAPRELGHAVDGVHLAVPLVETEGRLVDIPLKVLRADVVPSSRDGSLEHGPYGLDPVGVRVAPDVLTLAVGNGVMGVLVDDRRQRAVGGCIVGVDRCAGVHRTLDEVDQRASIRALHRRCLDLPAAFANTCNGLLADRAASRMEFLGLVLVRFLAADVGLVDFDHVAQREVSPPARFTYPVQHMPCGAVLHAKLFRQLQRGDALAGREDAVDGVYPVLQRTLGRVHASACRDGETLAAVLVLVAVVALALVGDDVLDTAAVRADRSAFPSRLLKPRVAGVLIGEHAEQLNDADRFRRALAGGVGAVALFVVLDDCHCRIPLIDLVHYCM